ncbi:hypothetical protein QLX08_010878, partial [Tetragonisca angustula]
NEGEKNN